MSFLSSVADLIKTPFSKPKVEPPTDDRKLVPSLEQMQADGAKVALYVSGPEGVGYQANMWIPVLERLSVKCAIVIRERYIARELFPTTLPIYYLNNLRDLELLEQAGFRTILYPANPQRNVQALRFYRLNHFFINHGESDKAVNQSKLLMAYDRLLVAGPLAERRLRAAKLPLRHNHIEFVGRPQVELKLERIAAPQKDLKVILYAPTWEGFVEDVNYSSIGNFGLVLLRTLLHSKRYKVLFKPHPYTGTAQKVYKRHLEAMNALAGNEFVELVDARDDIHGHMNRSDLMITDISSVLNDYLYTRKPMILTNSMGLNHAALDAQYPSSAATYKLDQPGKVLEVLRKIAEADPLWDAREAVCRDSLGSFPEGSLARFDRVIRESVSPWRQIAHRGGAGWRPQNTLSALEHAIDVGAAGAEIDVHLTRDGEVVLHHNPQLNHVYTKKDGRWITREEQTAIASLTYEELRAYDVGTTNPASDYAKRYPRLQSVDNEKIPRLRDAIKLIKSKSEESELVVEFKANVSDVTSHSWETLVDATLKVLDEANFLSRSVFCSFDWGALIYAKRRFPHIRTWFTTRPSTWLVDGTTPPPEDRPPRPEALEALRALYRSNKAHWFGGFDPRKFGGSLPTALATAGADGWFGYHRDITPELVAEMKARNISVAAWFMEDPQTEELERLRGIGVESICLDHPEARS